DAELGAIFAPALPVAGAKVIVHAGLALPTGSTGTGEGANVVGAISRVDDLYLAVPEGFSVRIGASPVYAAGNWFARVDLGLDANISQDQSQDPATILRINAGVGFRLANFAATAELVNLHDTRSSATGGDDWIDVAALSARMQLGTVTPYLSV